MITSVIIDDDVKNISILRALLEEFCPQIIVIGEATNIEEAASLITSHMPSLVFLDIEMPYGNGFELLDRLMPVDFAVIFITAYDNYAIKAIRYCALDYLLKPVNIKDLLFAVNKTSEQIHAKDTHLKLKTFFDHFNSIELQKIAVPSVEGLIFIDFKNIVRCESRRNYTYIFLSSGKRITSAKTIKEFEDILPPNVFFRVHNSHLINLNHIKRYFKGRGGYIVMEDDTNIEVASRRKDSFLDLFRKI
jgi:two-component system, LytTR family, response regulator